MLSYSAKVHKSHSLQIPAQKRIQASEKLMRWYIDVHICLLLADDFTFSDKYILCKLK